MIYSSLYGRKNNPLIKHLITYIYTTKPLAQVFNRERLHVISNLLFDLLPSSKVVYEIGYLLVRYLNLLAFIFPFKVLLNYVIMALPKLRKNLITIILNKLSLVGKFHICSKVLASIHIYYYSC